MARATAAEAAQTAQRLLETATQVFAAQGFADTSLVDVAQRAGVTRGAIYHHYQNKAGLFYAVVARLQEQIAEAVLRTAEDAGSSPSTQLRAGAHAFLDAITAPAVVRILLVDAPAVVGWDEWRQLDAQSSEVLLREVLQELGVEKELVGALTAQLSGAMNEAALWVAQHDDEEQARTQAHRALDYLLASVMP